MAGFFIKAPWAVQACHAGQAEDAAGLACPHLRPHLDAGRLVEVLREWRRTYEGYHLYYPNRRKSPALDLLVDALRHKG